MVQGEDDAVISPRTAELAGRRLRYRPHRAEEPWPQKGSLEVTVDRQQFRITGLQEIAGPRSGW